MIAMSRRSKHQLQQKHNKQKGKNVWWGTLSALTLGAVEEKVRKGGQHQQDAQYTQHNNYTHHDPNITCKEENCLPIGENDINILHVPMSNIKHNNAKTAQPTAQPHVHNCKR